MVLDATVQSTAAYTGTLLSNHLRWNMTRQLYKMFFSPRVSHAMRSMPTNGSLETGLTLDLADAVQRIAVILLGTETSPGVLGDLVSTLVLSVVGFGGFAWFLAVRLSCAIMVGVTKCCSSGAVSVRVHCFVRWRGALGTASASAADESEPS